MEESSQLASWVWLEAVADVREEEYFQLASWGSWSFEKSGVDGRRRRTVAQSHKVSVHVAWTRLISRGWRMVLRLSRVVYVPSYLYLPPTVAGTTTHRELEVSFRSIQSSLRDHRFKGLRSSSAQRSSPTTVRDTGLRSSSAQRSSPTTIRDTGLRSSSAQLGARLRQDSISSVDALQPERRCGESTFRDH